MNISINFKQKIGDFYDDILLYYGIVQKEFDILNCNLTIPDDNGIVYIYGISGSGKSLILREISKKLNTPIYKFDINKYNNISDLLKNYVNNDFKLLSMFGFSDVPVLITPVKYLSDGQKYRLFLLEVIRDNDIIIIDEFCNPLDNIYSISILKSLIKFKNKKRIFIATIKDNIYKYFDIDYVYYVRHGKVRRIIYDKKNILDDVIILKANINDWEYFSRFHYRSKSVGIFNYGLKAKLYNDDVGIIICGSPYLNINNRNRIFSKYKNNGKLVNKEIYMIHRIVVTPEVRNIGIAGKLILESEKLYRGKKLCELITSLEKIIPFTKKYGFKCGGKVIENPIRNELKKLNFNFRKYLDDDYVKFFIKNNEDKVRRAVISSYNRGISSKKEFTFDDLVYNVQRMCNIETYYYYKELNFVSKINDIL